MNRQTRWLLITGIALSLSLLLLPASQARRSAQGAARAKTTVAQSSNAALPGAAGIVAAGARRPAELSFSRPQQKGDGSVDAAAISGPQAGRAVAFRETPPLSSLAALSVSNDRSRIADERSETGSSLNERVYERAISGQGDGFDGALQADPRVDFVIPGPSLTFEGISSVENLAAYGFKVSPPDHTGDVGPNNYVQGTNLLFRVFDKAGNPLTPAFKLSSLFASFGPPCASRNDGYPQVLYDPLADRWLLSDFCTATTGGNVSQRIAVSTTSDPTGTYFAYIFVMPNSNFNDYPILGVWPDGYYMAADQFTAGGVPPFLGAGAFAFDRSKMLVGDPTAGFIYFDLAPTISNLLPTDVDGYVAPPTGTPNLFMNFKADELGDPADALGIFEFRPNFSTPASSTFTQLPDLPLAAFDARNPPGRMDVEQPPPATATQTVDSIADRLMPRLAYRNLGTNASAVNSYVLNFTVNVSGTNPTSAATYQAGLRWTELRRNPGTGAMTVNDQGTFAPGSGNGATGTNRWLGSIAQDNQGNIAVGFSISSTTIFPSINWAGRLTTDPAGTLGQDETAMFSSTGIQGNASNRWGSYSSMTVDPTDDCTFWYTNQYRTAANNAAPFDWNTRIGNFKFPTCTAAPKGTFSGTVTNCSSGLPIQNAVVETTSPAGFNRKTNASGNYSITAAPGTYSLKVSNPLVAGFNTATGMVTVTNGGNAVFNACIQAAPNIVSAGATIVSESCGPANGAIDPGETVTVSFCVQNTGSVDTTNLVGTLQATGGVTNQSGPQNYGNVMAGGPPVCRNYTFTADNALSCGGALNATLQFQDGASNLGTVGYTFTLGTLIAAFAQNFDGVVAPAIPAGWTSTTAQDPAAVSNPWATNTTTPDTAPNSVFTNDPANISDERLDTPSIAITSSSAQLTFRNNFNLEDAFDGGVLEIAIGAGAFTDIIVAGGSFVQGGYTDTISTSFMSPIGGRMAWSGSSGGYITTTVNLPAAAAGQNIRLRFRRATDNSTAGTGWRVDTISITDGFACCVTPNADLSVTKTDTPDPVNAGNNITYTITVTNNGPLSATNVVLTDNLPANTTFVNVIQTAPPFWTIMGSMGNITATIASFPSGATATFEYTVKVNPSVANGTSINNTATVSSDTADFNMANNSVTAATLVNVPPPPPLTYFVAVDANNNLLRFNSAAPSVITSTTPIIGLQFSEKIVGLDVRPNNGQVYGLAVDDPGATDLVRLYQIDLATGVATPITGAPIALTSGDFNYGFDFNPTVDRIRVVNANDENARINPNNGVRADAPVNDTDLNDPTDTEEVIGVAYDRNDTDPATGTTLYGIDRANSRLVTIGGINSTPSPNGGTVFNVGPLGFMLSTISDSGFDIVTTGSTNTAFAALRPIDSLLEGLYTIDLTTGQAAFVGIIDSGTPNIRGLTVIPSPNLSINDVTVAEGNAGSTNAMFTVTLSAPSDQTIMVDYFTSNGTAMEPADYTAVNGTLTFLPGQTSKTISVPVNGDTLFEGDETFFVNLVNANNAAAVTDDQGLGTITNDDVALPTPAISINDVSIAEGNSLSTNATFTVTLSNASADTVLVDFFTSNGTAMAPSDYTPASGTLTFLPGQTSKIISVPINGDVFNELDETFFVNLLNPANATIADGQGLGTILNDDPLGGIIAFSTANLSVAESAGSLVVTVNRTGDTSHAATIEYVSTDNSDANALVQCSVVNGTALSRCDFTTAAGILRFAAGETSKTFTVLITQDSYVEGPETFTITLSNPGGGAVLAAPSTLTIQITDDATEPATNAIDDAGNFVRQHYHDFLNRQPDAAGFAFWVDNITKCNDPARRPAGQTVAQCIDKQRESTSSAFFMSPEFQATGGFVYRLYKGSLPGLPNYDMASQGRYPTYLEFIRDSRRVAEGIIAGGQIDAAVLEANRAAFAEEFTQRPEFLAEYGALDNRQYVERLLQVAFLFPTDAERQALVDGLNNGTETRGSVLRKVVDGTVFISESNIQFTTTYGRVFYEREFRRAFVLMEYFGYLRRNPDTPGFNFWLAKLNLALGDVFKAEMVKAFIISPEYRSRFGTP